MNKDNNNIKGNNIDKKLHISDVIHSFICPKCGGNMIFDVELTHRLPVMYHHNCDSCKYHKNLYEKNCG